LGTAHDVGDVSMFDDNGMAECQVIFGEIFFNPRICGRS
jgi:hypothetical protein